MTFIPVSLFFFFEHYTFLFHYDLLSSRIRRTAKKLLLRIYLPEILIAVDRPGGVMVRARDRSPRGAGSNLGVAGSRPEVDFAFQSPRGPDFSFFQHYLVKG